jgi:hypothetical protein
MVYRGSNEARGLPIRQIARLLIQAGQEDPRLLRRTQTSSADRLSERATELPEAARKRRPQSSTDRHLTAGVDPYMEQLVSIAIASARRAENASEYASKTGRIAKRATTLITVFSVIGGLVSIAGIVDHRFNDRLQSALAPVTRVVHQGSTAQMPDTMVGGAPTTTPANIVITRSSVGRLDERLKPTAVQATSEGPQATSVPVGPAGVQAYSTRPYRLNASASQVLASRRSGLDQPHPAEAVLSRLRAQERQANTAQTVTDEPSGLSDRPQQPLRQASETAFPPPQADATQSALMPSPSANLMTARQLLVFGRTEEARNLLVRVLTQMVFQPVAPDQPAAEGRNVAATQVGDVIRWLDRGNTGSAMQAINIAMNSPTADPGSNGQPWQRFPPPLQPGYFYAPGSN